MSMWTMVSFVFFTVLVAVISWYLTKKKIYQQIRVIS